MLSHAALYCRTRMNFDIVVLKCHKCDECLNVHKSLYSLRMLSNCLCLFGQVLSPHHSETNIEHVCKFHISCIGASTGKMEKYFTRSLGSHTDSGWAAPGFAFIWNALPHISQVVSCDINPGGISQVPQPTCFWKWHLWQLGNMPFGFRSTLINWLLSLEPFNTKPTRYPKLPYRNCMPGR